jgi:putative intracellular protease/amidase
MSRILILMTNAKSLGLLHGRRHPSGFWAEEFVVPYDHFVAAGYDIDIATIDGVPPTPDAASLDRNTVSATRPAGSPDHDEENIAHYREVIGSVAALRHPTNVADLSRERLEQYTGIYVCGGHGAMEDLPYDREMKRVMRTVLELDKPLAVTCHGISALLHLRDPQGRWPLEGYRMVAFSHAEELVTEMAGQLPFVLQIELERLGAKFESCPELWGSCVIEDRNLVTGQNPYSSTELAEKFVLKLQSMS